MHTFNFISLILMALVFVIWAVAMFVTLGRISRQSREKLRETGGGYFTWVDHSFRAYREVLTADAHRSARRRLIFLTFLLCAIIAGRVLLLNSMS